MPDKEDVANQIWNQQQILVSTESQPLNAKLHLDVKLQNEGNAHSDSKISTHERHVELPNKDVHSDSDAERPNKEARIEPRLSKYVRRHHPTK